MQNISNKKRTHFSCVSCVACVCICRMKLFSMHVKHHVNETNENSTHIFKLGEIRWICGWQGEIWHFWISKKLKEKGKWVGQTKTQHSNNSHIPRNTFHEIFLIKVSVFTPICCSHYYSLFSFISCIIILALSDLNKSIPLKYQTSNHSNIYALI